MAERLQIWNAALGHIGEGTRLGGLNEPGTPAEEIRRHYTAEREAMLAGHPWRFAERVVTLTGYTPVPPGVLYAYRVPADCLQMRKVSDRAEPGAQSIEWRLGGATTPEGDDVALVLADQPKLFGFYTRRIENEASWPRLFATAMEWRLAWAISYPITRDLARREEAWRQFIYWWGEATAHDQRQVYELPREGDYILARGGYDRLLPADGEPDYLRQYRVA